MQEKLNQKIKCHTSFFSFNFTFIRLTMVLYAVAPMTRCALFAWHRMSFKIVWLVRLHHKNGFAGVCAERKVKCKQMQENSIKIRAGTFAFSFRFVSSLHSMHGDVYSIEKKV